MKKLIGKALLIGLGVFVGTIAIYWFNLENKLIYFGVRPALNWLYDHRKRDKRL